MLGAMRCHIVTDSILLVVHCWFQSLRSTREGGTIQILQRKPENNPIVHVFLGGKQHCPRLTDDEFSGTANLWAHPQRGFCASLLRFLGALEVDRVNIRHLQLFSQNPKPALFEKKTTGTWKNIPNVQETQMLSVFPNLKKLETPMLSVSRMAFQHPNESPRTYMGLARELEALIE